ncbi:MAG TPA: S-adenosylmethionine:tRNA ribosyltransferase-isomerase [Solirubrobacteraceae bacterium]|nr:S-adenosylmethionine:tRNA ribosyltransferase-isomerase [Solirubrobacteraceae bacterium]
MNAAAAAPDRRREAHEPPEARGLRRDEVRMLVAAGATPARAGSGDVAGATSRARVGAREVAGATSRAPVGAREVAGATSRARDVAHPTSLTHARARDLPEHLFAGDVLVVNTSATLPAALPARRADGTALRLHLSTPAAGGEAGHWVVELRRGHERCGDGRAGERLSLPAEGHATLLAPYLTGARLWLATIETGATPLHDYLTEHGAPIRYAHTNGDWPLADYQTVFALHPGSAEMPSAGRPFTPELVTRLVAHGVVVAPLTLHTGVSSLEAGESPYPERFEVPATTARLVNAARAGGGRVIAVGTSVVRALETVALPFGHVEPDAGWTRHVVTPDCGVRVVDGLLTGWHDTDGSHLRLLEAVGGRALIEDSYREALRHGYRWHEFGDVHLILP